MSTDTHTATSYFRALWPITDPTTPLRDLIAAATDDLPTIAVQAHARLTGQGRWSMAPSASIPGSGRITETVLIYEAPAEPIPARDYRACA